MEEEGGKKKPVEDSYLGLYSGSYVEYPKDKVRKGILSNFQYFALKSVPLYQEVVELKNMNAQELCVDTNADQKDKVHCSLYVVITFWLC